MKTSKFAFEINWPLETNTHILNMKQHRKKYCVLPNLPIDNLIVVILSLCQFSTQKMRTYANIGIKNLNWNKVSNSFFLRIFQMIQTAYDDARIPNFAYDILLGLYIPVMILGTTLNLFLLCTIFSTKKLRTEPR